MVKEFEPVAHTFSGYRTKREHCCHHLSFSSGLEVWKELYFVNKVCKKVQHFESQMEEAIKISESTTDYSSL